MHCMQNNSTKAQSVCSIYIYLYYSRTSWIESSIVDLVAYGPIKSKDDQLHVRSRADKLLEGSSLGKKYLLERGIIVWPRSYPCLLRVVGYEGMSRAK